MRSIKLGRPRDPAADAAILRAAMELFIEHGIDGATIEKIAERSGVARTTIYRRWSSREALLIDAIKHSRTFPETWGAELSDLDPALLFAEGVEVGMELLTRTDLRKLAAQLFGALPRNPALMDAYRQHYLEPRRAAFHNVLKRARREGILPADTDLSLLMDMLSGLMLYRLLLAPPERDRRKLKRYLQKAIRQFGFER